MANSFSLQSNLVDNCEKRRGYQFHLSYYTGLVLSPKFTRSHISPSQVLSVLFISIGVPSTVGRAASEHEEPDGGRRRPPRAPAEQHPVQVRIRGACHRAELSGELTKSKV